MSAKSNIYDLLNDNSSKVYVEYEKDADILNSQIRKDNVNNVAVVAKYGAGKSSVINTYLRKYRSKDLKEDVELNKLGKPKKNHYVRISLSTFNNVEYDEQSIERSILQQLLYSRKKNELPNSKIERTNKSSLWKTIILVIVFAVFIVFVFFAGLGFTKQEDEKSLEILSYEWLKYLYLVIAFISFATFFIFLLHNRFLKRFKYKDLEADFVTDKEKNTQYTNLINKFIDEVLYFFECVDVDLVIFEDLDRLQTTEIFAKLRELNFIINNSEKKPTKVTFLYAVKDDLFETNEERAKFFDFILHIIPVINPITAKVKIEEISNKIKKYNSSMELSGKLIRGISVFIPDMRILNYTFNDYILMYDKILVDENNEYLSNDKLFALCLYKNLFPHDYSLLEKGVGLIPLIIDMLNLRKKCLEKNDEELQKLKNKIRNLEDMKFQSFKQLHGLFILELGKLNYNVYYSGKIDPWTLKTFKGLNQKQLSHPKHSNNRIELPEGDELLGPNGQRFEDLEQDIIDKNNGQLETLKEKLNALEKEKQAILQWDFKKIVKEKGVDFFFEKEWKIDYEKQLTNFKKNNYSVETQTRYLKFMIAQGFIDEHYIEYTSNYKSKILSPDDTVLIQKINASETTFDDSFVNLKQVLRLLEDEEFSKEHIVIKSILDNLNIIKNFSFEERDRKFLNIIHLLKENNKARLKLIKYINISTEEQCNFLLTELLKGDLDFGISLINEKDIIFERKNLIFINLIKNNENFISLKGNTVISTFINCHKDYLYLLDTVNDDAKVFDFLNIIDFRVLKLIANKDSHRIQKYIISHNMFEINLSNLEVILVKDDNKKAFYSSNYSYILSTILKKYIQDNIEEYISNVLLNEEISCFEEEQINVEELLKNEEISLENRRLLLNKVHIKLKNISEYRQELYDRVLEKELIVSSWFNLEYSYERIGFESVRDFLRKTESINGKFEELEQISPETPANLINDILIYMNNNELEKVLNYLPATTTLSSLFIDKINDSNLEVFIRKKHIRFQIDDLNRLLNVPKSLYEYLMLYKQEVLNNFDQFFDIALPTISYKRVYEKGMYVNKCFAKEKELSQKVIKSILLCGNIDIKIKTSLIEKCKEIININSYEKEMADYIIKNSMPVNANILWQFSSSKNIPIDEKKQIYFICIDKVDFSKENKESELYLQNLGENYSDFIINDIPLTIEPNSIDDKIFEVLKSKNIYTKRKNKTVNIVKKVLN